MPVHALSKGSGADGQVPGHQNRIPLSLLSTDKDYTGDVVQGKVVCKGPLVSLQDENFTLKAVVQEEDSQPNASAINIFLFAGMAKAFNQSVSKGDLVVISGFQVAKSPTFQKDKVHPLHLLLKGDNACVYVKTFPANIKRPKTEVSRASKVPKYTYFKLNDLKPGAVVNVYGVVVFFKQPFKSRGTDYCSTLKITDQSNQKVFCTIFCEKLEDHPKIFQIGDIIRMHRVKTKIFNDAITLVSSSGFSVVTFDGTMGSAVEPRTSSSSFHFDQRDRQTVDELRSWVTDQDILPRVPIIPLSAVQPKAYFDLTCQLLAKAPVDSTCILLRVWDGTRCPHTLLKVEVESKMTEGSASITMERDNLIADVLVYDNHVQFATQLKPGNFLRIYNLQAIPGTHKVPSLTSNQSEEIDNLTFHLHGGTAYGRGIRVLPENSPDVQELKRVIDAYCEDEQLNDSLTWNTPPEETPGTEAVSCCTERTCGHDVQPVTLRELRRSNPRRVHHVRAQLSSYEPRRLHQSLKLYCSKCKSMQDIPDDETVAGVFLEACRDSEPCSLPPWALSGLINVSGESSGSPKRTLGLHLSTQLMSDNKTKQLIFLRGSTLEEICQLASSYENIVPVKSSGSLLNLSAPFLFRGRKRYYGCRRCSEATLREPSAEGVEHIDENIVAEALGVQLLHFVLLMKFELQDATDSLDVFLWRDAELFFKVSAEDVATSQESQNCIRQTMDFFCPAEGSTGERPWLDLCLMEYQAEDHGGQSQTCYQICHTSISKLPSTCSEPGPA